MTITDVQVDNSLLSASFPVLVQRLGSSTSTTLRHYETRHLLEGVDLPLNIDDHPLLDIMCKRHLYPETTTGMTEGIGSTGSFLHFEVLRIIVLGLIVKADMGFLTAALDVMKTFSDAFRPPDINREGRGQWIQSGKHEVSSHEVSSHEVSHDVSHDVSQDLSSVPSQNKSCTNRPSTCRFLFHNPYPLYQGHGWYFTEVCEGERFVPPAIELAENWSTKKCYFETFIIHPLLLRLSFTPTVSSLSHVSDNTGIIMRLFSSIGSIQEVPIYFNVFRLQDKAKMITGVLAILKGSYSAQLWRQSYALASSVDLLGNPLSTFSHLGAGLGDLVAEPVRSYQKESEEDTVLTGLGKGAKSLWDNTVYGAFNVVSKVSGAAAQGLGVLAMDDQYARERQQQVNRRKPKDASEGFAMGAEAFGKAVVGGLRGLVAEPSKGVEEKGFEGLVQGVGKCVVGALVKPMAGVFEMTALAAGGIQQAAGESSGVARGRRQRQRPPRMFYGADRIFKNYSLIDATLNDSLLYVLGIDWDTFIVDYLLYDKPLNYVSILNGDELLTVALLPEPHADVYCDLWHIISCDAVGPGYPTSSSSSTASIVTKTSCVSPPPPPLRPSTTSSTHHHLKSSRQKLLLLQAGMSSSRPGSVGKKHHAFNEKGIAYLPTRRVSRTSTGRSHKFIGVLIKLHPPLPSRCIRTSTIQLAAALAEMINEKIAKL